MQIRQFVGNLFLTWITSLSLWNLFIKNVMDLLQNYPLVRKFIFRFVLITAVFFCIKLTENEEGGIGFYTISTLFYYVSSFIFFFMTWEINEWLIR